MKHTFIIFFVIISLLLCGCNNTTAPSGTTPSETEVQSSEDLCLYENGAPIYSIVRPDGKNEIISSAVSTLWKALMNSFECELTTNSDWAADPSEIPVGTPEILVGPTNRPESAEVQASLDGLVYRVTAINNRIVIAAASDLALEKAVDAFLGTVTLTEDGRVTVPANLDISCTNAQAWEFTQIPSYDTGVYNGSSVTSVTGYDGEANPSYILGITQTTADEFAAYIEKVQNDGFTVVPRAAWDSVTAYQCDKDDISFYTYYTSATNEVRILLENSSTVSTEDFSYTYEKAENETNDVYLYGLYTETDTNAAMAEYPNNGQFLFIKLADNSLFVIDGGKTKQVDENAFIRFAREITGTPEGEKIRIACWFITHSHTDHYQGFQKVVKNLTDQIVIERILYNFKPGTEKNFDLRESYPDILYHKPHTGETIDLGSISFDVLYTQEDALDLKNMTFVGKEDTQVNESSTVLRVHMDDKICMILGDIDTEAGDIIQTYYSDEELKADVVQIAHHGFNHLHNLYETMDAKIALYPTSNYVASGYWVNILTSVTNTCDELYFGGDETVGVRIIDGEAEVFFRNPIDYSSFNTKN